MFTITSVLAFFALIMLSSAVFFAAKRLKLPYTVLLVVVGMLLVPLSSIPALGESLDFINELRLTPELLFYIFLPILIFESGFNIKLRKFIDSAWSITALSVFGAAISTFLIAGLLYFILPFVGVEIPLIAALLFGAIISATDPVAVLALFKEVGTPKRLTMIFEGESLFNDGTAVALFLVILAIAQDGFYGTETVLGGILSFVGMVVLGVILGLVLAGAFTKLLRYTRSNEFVAITLLITSAHIVFIAGELINKHGLFGVHFHVSSIIATTIAALFMGNYARNSLSPKSDEYLNKFIEHMAFLANSLVFLLAGLLFASANIALDKLWLPILLTVVIVAVARALMIWSVIKPLNKLKLEESIPGSWQKLLAWGSLRGALAIIIVLLIPENLSLEGWTESYTLKEFLLAITIGCILTTLFIKAPLISPLIKRLKIDKPDPLEEAYSLNLELYYLLTEEGRLLDHHKRGFVEKQHFTELKKDLRQKINDVSMRQNELSKEYGKSLFDQALELLAINAENGVLKQLYINYEVDERTYQKIKNKLNLQQEKIEKAQHDRINPSEYMDNKDIFYRLVNYLQKTSKFNKANARLAATEELAYYRAQMIMARKCVKTLNTMQNSSGQELFRTSSFDRVISKYEQYRQKAEEKVKKLCVKHGSVLGEEMRSLAQRSLNSSGKKALNYLEDRNIIDAHFAEHMEKGH